jgi:hypothetical protein
LQGVDAILSYRCLLLQSFTPQCTRLRIYRGGQTTSVLLLSASPGVFVPTAFYGTGSPYNSGLTSPDTLRSQGFDPLSGFRLPVLPGLFHPGTLLGFSLQSLPFQKSRRASRRPLPSCRYRLASSAVDADLYPIRRERKDQATRLQGLAPFWSPFSRAWRLASAWGRCSLGLLPLQGFPHPLRCSPFGTAPLLCLPLRASLYQVLYAIPYSILTHRIGNTTRPLIQIRPERHTSEFQSIEYAVDLSRDPLPS